MRLEFGFYPRSLDVTSGAVTIETLPGLVEKVDGLTKGPWIYKDWVYAPMQATRDFSGNITELPFPSRVFGLTKTHAITHGRPTGKDHVDYLVWCLSFFVGMRLTTREAGFVDATPSRPHALTDFILSGCNEADAIVLAEEFWATADAQSRSLMVAAIHALFLAQNPRLLQYEEFFHLYAALDAAYALMKRMGRVGYVHHFQRVEAMCTAFGMDTPIWAKNVAGDSEVASLRNPAFHEALFSGEPLGFAIYRGANAAPGLDVNVLLEMQALMCRFIVALLGRPATDYVRSPVTTRQTHGVNLR